MENSREKGLFETFFLKQGQQEDIRPWTHEKLQKKSKSLSFEDIQAYVGLALAASLMRIGSLKELWSSAMFSGHADFSQVMARSQFQEIRPALTFRPVRTDCEDVKLNDPFLIIWPVCTSFQKRLAEVATPLGVASLYRNTVPTKARTTVNSFIPSKLDLYGIRFYALVGSGHS